MNRMLLIMSTMASLIVFFIVTSYVPGFGAEKAGLAKKEVEIPITLSVDDGGKNEGKLKDNSGWEKHEGPVPGDAEIIFQETITVYKKNPCYVCIGGICYMKNPC